MSNAPFSIRLPSGKHMHFEWTQQLGIGIECDWLVWLAADASFTQGMQLRLHHDGTYSVWHVWPEGERELSP